ncbi:MAG: hypothetical protein RMJ15_03880 [Nitrososphaerota archaeon]|nr:hypothetical protein [Candidatus Bathyarchaeota archaeon]MDW8022863.1 hypothetical protein [Nitrososphaerota archaeon]
MIIGKHNCSKCGGKFKLREGLMISIIEGGGKATFFLCRACLENGVPYQSEEFDIKKTKYPKLGLR